MVKSGPAPKLNPSLQYSSIKLYCGHSAIIFGHLVLFCMRLNVLRIVRTLAALAGDSLRG